MHGEHVVGEFVGHVSGEGEDGACDDLDLGDVDWGEERVGVCAVDGN